MGQGGKVTDTDTGHPYPVGFYVPPLPPPGPKPRPARSGGATYSKAGLVKDGLRTLFMDYDDQNDVLAHLEQERMPGSGTSSSKDSAEDSWDLGIGWEGALDAYTGGWAEGAQKAYELAERIKIWPIDRRTTFVRDVAGSFPNVGAYLAGAPNAMYRPSRKTAKARPFVHLYVPIGYSGGTDANTAFDRGCAIVALCDALETSGARVKITLIRNSFVSDTTRISMRFKVKDYGERLDIDQVIFTAAHPAMFRRICFGLQERSEHKAAWQRAADGGYGRPTGPIRGIDTEDDGNAHVVILPRLARPMDSPEAYLAQMIESLPEELKADIAPGGGIGIE